MMEQQQVMMTRMYVEDRLARAAHERLLREAAHGARRGTTLTARVGRTLVRLGQRLETAGADETWRRAEVA